MDAVRLLEALDEADLERALKSLTRGRPADAGGALAVLGA